MKKLILMALAIAAMAACTKSNVEFDQPGEIAFQPVAQKATKAAVVGTEYPTAAAYNFNVWAWWGAEGQTEFTNFKQCWINEQPFEYRSALELWGGSGQSYYWPTTGSLYFAGYSPASIKGKCTTLYERDLQQLTITDYQQSTVISNTVDLMWFHLTDQSYDRNTSYVPVKFHHALSWLTFRFNLKNSDTPELWTVTSVKLNGIETKGNFVAKKTGTSDAQGVANWSENLSEPKIIDVFGGNYTVSYVTNEYSPLTDDPSVLENSKNGVLVIPQSCAPEKASLEIKFKQQAPSGQSVEQTKTLNLGDANGKWLPGKHYIYTITFGAEEILISPTVVDWDSVDDLSIPVK